jgi:hypothetical protein
MPEKERRTFDIDSLDGSDIHNTHQQTFDDYVFAVFVKLFGGRCTVLVSSPVSDIYAHVCDSTLHLLGGDHLHVNSLSGSAQPTRSTPK